MKKIEISQPPFSDYYTMVVEDISENGRYGTTQNIDHINYNREIMGEKFDLDVAVKQLTVKKGVTTVFQCGIFICVMQLKYDNTEGNMRFMAFEEIGDSTIIEYLRENNIYSDNVLTEILKNYDLMIQADLEFLDSVRLHVL